MDSLEAFLDKVDGKLRQFGHRFEAAAGEARVQTHLGLAELDDFWSKRKSDILGVASRLKEAQGKPKAVLEEGKIELYFGKEDAKEAFAELRQRLERTQRDIAEIGTLLSSDASSALQRVKDAYDAISDKILH